MENNVREQGLSLVLLWKLLWKNVLSVVYFMLVGVILSVVYTQQIAKPSYSATGTIENLGSYSANQLSPLVVIAEDYATIRAVVEDLTIPVAEENIDSKVSEISAGLSVSVVTAVPVKVTFSYGGASSTEVVEIVDKMIDRTIERFLETTPAFTDKIQKQTRAITAVETGLSNTILYVAFVFGAAVFGVLISVGGDLMRRKLLFATDISEYNLPSHIINLNRKKKDPTPILESQSFTDGLLVLQDRIEGAARRSAAKIIGIVNLGYDTYDTLTAVLAENLSTVGLKTVIVDLDFEKPLVHTLFGVDQKHSVTNILSGGSTKPVQVKDGVFALPTEAYAYPARFLKDERLAALLNDLAKEYDYVLVNVPKIDYYASLLFNFNLINMLVVNVSFEGTTIKDIDEYIGNLEVENRKGLFLNAINSSVKKNYFGFTKNSFSKKEKSV